MDEDRFREEINTPQPSEPNRAIWAVVIVLVCAFVATLIYAFHQRQAAQQLAGSQDQMNTALNQTRSHVDALTAQLSDMSSRLTAAQQAAQQAAQPAASASTGTATHGRAAHKSRAQRDDPRFKKMQAQLEDEQKQIASTQQDLAQARTDLENNLNSTRDDLNGSIARNHDELVALEKRGERSYFEFDLTKSKQFQHVGPMSLSLRKTSTKHDNYSLAMLVDDKAVNRKSVNLYEPILFYPPDSAQPLEVVVNQIGKDHVHGYISAPKYRKSELESSKTSTASPGSTATPSNDSTSDTKGPISSASPTGPTAGAADSPNPGDDAGQGQSPAQL